MCLLKYHKNLNYSGSNSEFYIDCSRNYYLHRLRLVDSPLCVFCKKDPETIDHLFVECQCVKELWCKIEDWLLEKQDKHVDFNKQAVLFESLLIEIYIRLRI